MCSKRCGILNIETSKVANTDNNQSMNARIDNDIDMANVSEDSFEESTAIKKKLRALRKKM